MSQNCIPLGETSGANKFIALKDTEGYLSQQCSSRRTMTLLYQGCLHSIRHSRVAVRSWFLRTVKAPEVAGQFKKQLVR
jgi:hypothetical protein